MLQRTEVVAKHLFIQIPEEMKLFDANVGSFESALEQAPEILQPVSVNAAINVPFRVVNDFMLESLVPQALIGHERIGIDRTSGLDVSENVTLQSMLATVAYDGGANFSAAFQHTHDGHFVFGASLSDSALALVGVHESGRAADESFVHFYFATGTAHANERAVLHRKPDAVKHEPCGLLSDTESASHFIGTDSVLAVRNHPDSDEPFVQRKCGILK